MQLRTIFRNIASNWSAYIVTALVGLFLSPFIVHRLGTEGYGVWVLAISFTGYFGLLDMGIRSSLGRFVARNVALDDPKGTNCIVSSAFAMLTVGGAIALFVTFVIVRFLLHRFNINPADVETARLAILLVGLNAGMALPSGVFTAVLIGTERFDLLSIVNISSAVLRAFFVVLLLHLGYGIKALAFITLAVGILGYAAILLLARHAYPLLRISIRAVNLTVLGELFQFSIYRFIWIGANQLIFYTSSVVIGLFMNASSITYYSIAATTIDYGRNLVSQMTDTFYPLAARLHAKSDYSGLAELLIFSTKSSLLLSFPLCIGLLILGRQFIGLWMGPQFALSATILIILTIPQISSMSQFTSALVLTGMARHKFLAYVAILEGFSNLALALALVSKLGLIGIAIAAAVPHALTTGVVIPWYMLRSVRLETRAYLSKAMLKPALCLIPFSAACLILSSRFEKPTWGIFILEVCLSYSIFLLFAYRLCLDADQRKRICARVKAFMARKETLSEA